MCGAKGHVRFGSKADIWSAKRHVRFTPNNDRESGLSQTVMSALPPKADMCGARAYVCFGPIADIAVITVCQSAAGTRASGQIRSAFCAQ